MSESIASIVEAPIGLRVEQERWPLRVPFRITGHSWDCIDVVRVSLEHKNHVGQGEAAGVYYRQETALSVLKQIEGVTDAIVSGANRSSLDALLPAGGARNAIDCALWDLESKLTGRPVWQMAGLKEPHPLLTTFTCSAESPESMAATARAYTQARAIKLKLTGEEIDAERVRAVREARPDVWLGIDANQGLELRLLEALMPTLVEARVALIEQPFPVGSESLLDGFRSPIPIAADESLQALGDLEKLVGRFNMVNIKLDKCGGLTDGLSIAKAARERGLEVMMGSMLGTSLAMAPAFVLGQLCSVVDLDPPVFLKTDRSSAAEYDNGYISCPRALWGYPP